MAASLSIMTAAGAADARNRPSWFPPEVLLETMAESGQRMGGASGKTWPQVSFSFTTTTNTQTSPIHTTHPPRICVNKGICTTTHREKCDCISDRRERDRERVRAPVVFGSKKGNKRMETSFKLQKTERLHKVRKVQDGKFGLSEKNCSKKRLFDKSGLKGRIFSRSNPPRSPKIPAISVGGEGLSVQKSPLRDNFSTESFHKSAQTHSERVEKERSQTSRIFRRYISDVEKSKEVSERHEVSDRDAREVWIYDKSEEVRDNTSTQTRVLRNRDRHAEHAADSAEEEVEEVFERSKTDKKESTTKSINHSTQTSRHNRQAKLTSSSNTKHTFTLKRITPYPQANTQVGRVDGQRMGPDNASQSGGAVRTTVVGGGSFQMERHFPAPDEVSQDHLHGRQFPGLRWSGSGQRRSPQGSTDYQGVLVPQRRGKIYQRTGDGGTGKDATGLCQTSQMEERQRRSVRRQCKYSVLLQQGGGSISPSSRSFEYCDTNLRKISHSDFLQVRGHERELSGGRSKSLVSGPLRLETESQIFSKCRPSVGPSHCGLDSHPAERPAPPILQLDSGRDGDVHRRSSESKQQGERLFKSSFRLNSGPTEVNQRQESHDDDLNSGLDGATLVASPHQHGCGLPSPATKIQGHVSASRNTVNPFSSSSSSSSRSSSSQVGSGRLESILESLVTQGFSEEVTQTIAEHTWREGTLRAYEAPWAQWITICKELKEEPLSPTLPTFATFLNNSFRRGKAWSTTNTAASAVATAVHLTSGVNMSDHPVIIALKKAIRSARPASAAYQHTWDVTLVFRWVKSLGANRKLTRIQLTMKVICLLKIDLMARGSDLARLYIDQIQFVTGGVKVRFHVPKEWGPSNKFTIGRFSSWVFVSKYSRDKAICSVETLRFYMDLHKKSDLALDRVCEGVSTRCLFVSVVRDIKGHKGPHTKGKYYSLTSDTITNYMVKAMHLAGVPVEFFGHSTRSAAISKSAAAGASKDCIMSAARLSNSYNLNKYYLKDILNPSAKKRSKSRTMAAFLRSGV